MENAVSELMERDKEKARPVIPETMRAAVVEKFREPLQIREVPVPSPGPGQALSKSSRPACVIPTCTRPMAIGRSNRLRHLSPDMKVLVLWWRSARVSLT